MPARFILCVDRVDEPNGRVWCVRTKGQWINASRVVVNVPTVTIFRGPTARQPKAFLEGIGEVRQHGSEIVISTE
jgi:hypothetical protein